MNNSINFLVTFFTVKISVILEEKGRSKSMYWQVIMENEEVILFAAVLVASLWLFIKRVYVERLPSYFYCKYVFLTGCDSGFGRETALRLDSLGFNVFATCLTREGQADLTAMCSKRLKVIHLDVTDSQEIRNAYKFVEQSLPENTGMLLWKRIQRLNK